MDQKLKTRGISGLIFVILFLILLLRNEFTQLFLYTLIGLGTTYEFLKINQVSKQLRTTILFFCLTLLMTTYFFSITLFGTIESIAITSISYVFIAYLFLRKYYSVLKYSTLLSLLYPFFPLILLVSFLDKEHLSSIILGSIIIIWTNDSMAYLVGRKLGKHKLAPQLSPNKTIEGFLGGLVFSILISVIISTFITTIPWNIWVILGFLIGIGGVIGDLIQSSIKRHCNVKDSGNIMPGHGGFYDRFDSFVFVIPLVLLVLKIIDKI